MSDTRTGAQLRLSEGFRARFQMGDLLGRGGMGAVYKAVDQKTGLEVAIKFMTASLFEGDDSEQRFFNEARTLAALDHPNLVKVFEAGKDGDTPFIVFEFVKGTDLKGELRDRGRLDPYEALEVAGKVLQALKVAHAKNIIHRDIKSENILVASGGRVKLVDFGIAKLDQAKQTQTGVIVGTPAYMAPEQAQAKPLDARTDVYALGVVLFEMLTGTLPFGEENSMATMMAHINDPVPAPSYLVEGLPQLLDELVAGALAKNPADRYPSAGTFAIAIETSRKKLEAVGYTAKTGAQAAATDGATRAMTLEGTGASPQTPMPGGTMAHGTAGTSPTAGATRAQRSLEPSGIHAVRSAPMPTPVAPDPGPNRALLLGGGAVVLLVAGVLLGGMLFGGAGEEPRKLADPGAAKARELLERVVAGEEPEAVLAVLLRSELPRAAAAGPAGLATEIGEELRRHQDEDLVEDRRIALVVQGRAALGDPGAYEDLLFHLGDAEGDARARILECLHRGLISPGGLPSPEAGEELARALWRHVPAGSAPAAEREAFFHAAAALGSEHTVSQLGIILERGSRGGYAREVQASAVRALGEIAGSGVPGAASAAELIRASRAGSEDAPAVDLSSDEEFLKAVTDSSESFTTTRRRSP